LLRALLPVLDDQLVERRLRAEPVALPEAPGRRRVEVKAAVLQLQQGPVGVVPVQALLRARELQVLRAESAPAALAAERPEQDGGRQPLADGLAPVVAAAFLVEDAGVGPVTDHVRCGDGLVRGSPESRQSRLQSINGPADMARLDQVLGFGISLPALPEVAHDARKQTQHAPRPLEIRVAAPAGVERVDEQGMEGIGALELLTV